MTIDVNPCVTCAYKESRPNGNPCWKCIEFENDEIIISTKFYKKQAITNADRIRAMSDEELAEYLDGVCHDLWQMFVKDPKKMWLEWLKQECKT